MSREVAEKVYFVRTIFQLSHRIQGDIVTHTYSLGNLYPMDLSSNSSAPVLTDPPPMNKSRLGIHSALLPYTSPGAPFSSDNFITIPRKKPGILERTSSWLDAMKSSSPTHKRTNKDSSTELSLSETDVAYRKWMVFFPIT